MWNLEFPCGYGTVFEIDFDTHEEEAIIEMRLPHFSEMPTITRYRYSRQQKKLEETRLTTKQIRDHYQDLLAQLTLATLFRLFHDATTPYLQSIVFNGYVSGVHPATGRSFTSCVLSVRAERLEFDGFDLGGLYQRPVYGVYEDSLLMVDPFVKTQKVLV